MSKATHGKVTMKNLRSKLAAVWHKATGKSHSASNERYNVQKIVHKQLESGSICADELLPVADNKQQEVLLRMICEAGNKHNEGQPPSSSTVEKIKSYIAENMQHMTTEFLDRIEQISMMSGLFTIAYEAREKNEELLLLHADTEGFLTNRNARKLFWAYINRDEDAAAGEMSRKGALKNISIQNRVGTARHIRALCAVLGINSENSNGKANTGKQSREDTMFADFVRGKSIAVIGPSSSEVDISKEVGKDFDIVIRCSFFGSENLPPVQQSLPMHISYYGGIDWNIFHARLKENNFLTGLDFAVLSRSEQKANLSRLGYTTVRVSTHVPVQFLPLGKNNMIQVILHDLSFYEPVRIKVFSCNLFLSKTPYDKGYMTGYGNRDKLMQRRTYVKHNPISNYNYMRALYKRGLIEADERLTEVLQLGTAEYMRELEAQDERSVEK
ncbi:MAG: hypothetical protein FWG92_08225 [Leptospirales bacterium]|nr:hypothetical protein [Leptospirales bacterium]